MRDTNHRGLPVLVLPFTVLAFVAAGCSSSSGPSGPNLSGTWTGVFGQSPIGVVFTQSDTTLGGTFTDAKYTLSLTGVVSQAGSASWSTKVDQSDCTAFAADRMVLNAAQDSLVGIGFKDQGAKLCDPASGGTVLVQQGTMVLVR